MRKTGFILPDLYTILLFCRKQKEIPHKNTRERKKGKGAENPGLKK